MSKSSIYKCLTLGFVKYGPSLMAITCCLKIHILSYRVYADGYELTVNVINLLLNLFLLLFFYSAGKYLGYCWRHRSICRMALWGYVYYMIFLIFKIPHSYMHYLAVFYVSVVILFTAAFSLLQPVHDLKKTRFKHRYIINTIGYVSIVLSIICTILECPIEINIILLIEAIEALVCVPLIEEMV